MESPMCGFLTGWLFELPIKQASMIVEGIQKTLNLYSVAVKELTSSYHIGETQKFTIYTHHGNLSLSPLTATQYTLGRA